MTAWISRIKLTNFKSYENAEFNFPQPQDNGGNLILIGALNGHGKTTLLEALFLGLYGEKSADILKRAVHYKEEQDLLENALSIVAKNEWQEKLDELKSQNKPIYVHKDSQLNVQILIDISYVNECNKKTLTVNRTWGFKFDDKSKDFKLQKQQNKQQNKFFFTLKEESKPIEIEENQFLEIFSEYMPNWNHARFFLFDGEKLADIGDKNHFIRSGLNDLIGITLLDNTVEGKKGIKQALEERLDKLLRASKKNKKEQAELDKKQKQLDKIVKDIADKQSQQQQIEEQLSEYAKERDRLTNSLGDNNAKSTQELLKEKQQIEQDKQGLENNIQTALKELPLYLLPNKEINNFNQKIKAEFERIKLENNRKKLAPNLKKFNAKFFEEFEKEQGKREAQILDLWKDTIELSIKNAWHSLYYPLPEQAAEYVRHNYLSEINHQDIATTIAVRKTQGLPQMQSWLQESERYGERLTKIDKEIEEAGISHKDEYLKKLKSANEKISHFTHESGSLKNQLQRLDNEKQTLESEIQTLRKNMVGDDSGELGKLERLIDAIDLLRERLIVQKQQDLQDNTLEIYNLISHDERVKSVYITPDKVEFLDKSQNEVAESSKGETQLQLTALVLALSKTTEFTVPMVIDTPLARLDEVNRENLLNYLASLPQQVILLAQSGEINRNKCDELLGQNKAQKTFVVESEGFETGRMATVSEDYYFSE
ncbi:MAG: hypothetical protein IJ187_01375 [Neisseriaceae bacterium]|nr:hypothetical protein [Neisseriaceae bacterium]